MKTNLKLSLTIMALLLAEACALAQVPATLVSFDGGDGANPQAALVAGGNSLYGTTYGGGSSSAGTVFVVNANGTGFSNLYSFTGGSDGRGPQGRLVLSGNMLYGTTELGGAPTHGVVFAVNTNGGGFTNLYSFNGPGDGAEPVAGLVLAGNMLYGTTYAGGGSSFSGAVFGISTNGSVFTNIYNFNGSNNGAHPEGGLALSGNTLYGTTYAGGSSGNGIVFRVNTDGSGFSNLYNFTGGSDGANPESGLALAGGTLYGTASGGGDFDNGTVFRVNTNGGGFYSCEFNYSDGANPQGGLLLAGNTLYGTTTNGGTQGWGAIFEANTNLGSIGNLYSFTEEIDGAVPEAGLTLLGGTLYGTTQADTSYGSGTVFALNVPGFTATLNIARQGGQAVLSWTNAAFVLQSAANLPGPWTNLAGATSPSTNTVTGTGQFFRLCLPVSD
jgi:uncharacterized repeat protein (TIGR03803 family)